MNNAGVDRFSHLPYEVRRGGPEVEVSDESVSQLARTYACAVYSEFIEREGEEKWVKFTEERIRKKLQMSETIYLMNGEDLVAFASWSLVNDAENSPIVELSMNTVSADHQGGGIGKALARAREDAILEKYPGAKIGVITKNSRVIINADKNGYEEVSLERYFQMIGPDGRYQNGEVDPDLVKEGFVALIKNPREIEGSLKEFNGDLMGTIEAQSPEQGT